MSDAKKKVMQAFLLICTEWSDSHFLMFMKTHINLYYVKILQIYTKDLLKKNGLQMKE